jgi:TolB-like protein/tRNA A-37 threonylcarbamoyl transferase component Bud32/Tfp pilus assembly protein PilF
LIGRVLSHYRILEELGAGGMGVVYKARDERLKRDVALKVLPPGALSDPAARKRFQREALALAQLNHPHVATIHDFDSAEGRDFLVMELVEGESLNERLAAGALSEREVSRLAVQLLQGLAAAHARGVIHRDLKPANIRITPDGRLKILDFGLARLLEPQAVTEQTVSASATGQIAGTLPYMAPDQLRGAKPDERTDIYGAGAVLYEMATGRRPFQADTAPALMGAILHEEPAPPRSINGHISPGFERVLLRALEKDPGRRYQSAREFTAALEGAAPDGSGRQGRTVWARLAAGAVVTALVVAAVFLAGPRLLSFLSRAPRTIAVLPFVNDTGSADLEYLSDGLTDGLIYGLSEMPGVEKVIARASVFEMKGKPVKPREVGRRLDVRTMVTGRLARQGEQMTVSVELVSTRDGRLIWGHRYARPGSLLATLDRDLVADVSSRLKIPAKEAHLARMSQRAPRSEAAYRLYLEGRYHWNKYTESDLRTALEFFRRAVDADPAYALGYAGMADTYYQLSSTVLSAVEAMPKARAAAKRALELDPQLAEGHAALGAVLMGYDWAWDDAASEYRRAIALNPNYSTAYHYCGMALTVIGQTDEANRMLRRARELDPLSPSVANSATWPLFYARPRDRRYEEAARELEAIRAEYPDFPALYVNLIPVYVGLGQAAHAASLADSVATLEDWASLVGARGFAYARAGRTADARRILEKAEARVASDPSAYATIIRVLAGLGEKKELLHWIERGVAARSEEMVLIGVDGEFDLLRSDPRFKTLLASMNLPESLAGP